jgi:hypothetical protein
MASTSRPRASAKTSAPSLTFRAKVAAEDENFVVRVPFDVKEVFGKARPPIIITVGSYSFRWTVAVYGGESYIGFRRSHREAAGLRPGQTVSITITLDDQPRVVETPSDLAKALKTNRVARAAWDALSFTHKREHAEALLDAKKPETRTRRLEKTIQMLLARPVKKSS